MQSKAEIRVSNEIKNGLEQYIQQEQSLLDEFLRLKRQRKDVRTEIGKAIVVEGVAAFATDLLESSRAGRYGRKIAKSILDQKQKEQILIGERSVESRHDILIQDIRNFLSSVSIKKRRLKEPNSYLLTEKIDKTQDFVKVDTRIRRTITALKTIANKPLIYNRQIRVQQEEVVIPPGKPFTSALKLKKILQNIRGYAKIIDPYIDETTLELLLYIPEGVPIKVLTAYTGGKDKERRFQEGCRRFKIERPQFEIRKCKAKLIHDRFMLDHKQGWNIGSSLKDIGKSMSMIKVISSQGKGETEKLFDKLWSKAKPV